MQLKILEESREVNHLFKDTFSLHSYIHSCHSITDELTRKILTFIVDYGKQQNTLDDMCKIIKCFIEINQEVLSEFKEEWSHRELCPLVYDYYRISQGTYKLYSDFLRLLKDAADHWFSVKLALGQMMTKSKTEVYSYKEILLLLNDLEGAECIRFSDHFIKSFACICEQTAAFSRRLSEEIQNNKKLKSVTLMEVSSIMIGGVFGLLAASMGNDKLLQGMKAASSCSECLQMINSFGFGTPSYWRELCILEFFDCAVVIKELNINLARFGSFTPQFKEEMSIANDKLEEKINNFSKAIEDMCRHRHIYSLYIREAGLALSRYISDSNLQVPSNGETFMLSKELYENPPLNEEASILYIATLSVPIDSLWYIFAYEAAADSSLPLSCDSVINDNTNSIINILCGWRSHSLDDIHEVIICLKAINQEAFMVLSECKEEWRVPKLLPLVVDYHKLCLGASQLYIDFIRLLKSHFERCSTAILASKKNIEVNVPNIQDFIQGHNDNTGVFMPSRDFIKAIADICNQTLVFTRHFDEDIQESKSVKILAKVSSGLIAGVFCVMANCIVDIIPWTSETLNDVWLFLNRSLSWKSPLQWVSRLAIKDFSEITSLRSEVDMKAWSCHATCWKIMEYTAVLEKIDKLSVAIEDMTRHAHKYRHDIREVGTTLELTTLNHVCQAKSCARQHLLRKGDI